MEYVLNKNIRDNPKLRQEFDALAVKIFDLSFADWYQQGYWTDKYIPYVLLDRGNIIANASVNIIDTLWKGQNKRYIQIGTVMTDINYRKQGLSRFLMESILKDWSNLCDGIYLFANDSVLDFYPKFGFGREREYQCTMEVFPNSSKVRKLNMDHIGDRELLKIYYEKSNPFSCLPMLHNYELLMFYCIAPMRDCIFYLEEYDAVVIAGQAEESFSCYDIYCDEGKDLQKILAAVVNAGTRFVELDFPFIDMENCAVRPLKGEDTLFVLGNKENIFKDNKLMFPVLSHA